ncbi:MULTISPECIES: UDP-2,4-diacetamido-2,4,6-trideoxy-beta-L-altropyranose hydrolase [unclassified Psychrobacter]|uniref:UDP-2,4-diacetamido-2,4, 6-trideoxy-beta-L-altropyranose hydrolase n=2 Tax=Psychrobacter TaxID=497 RepID=UPI000424F530|nr:MULTISPECIES: UDP-2,4-diacetamido-2,4,6-trideoxy-beta-L-altropyranose hydrolase [unclassified Psychrobacter]
MNVVFRCDASILIGTGHVMRCLTLADELARQGAKCYFICREHEGNLIDLITKKGYKVYKLDAIPLNNSNKGEAESTLFHSEWLGTSQAEDAKQTIDIVSDIEPKWLIVDHYALNDYWEQKFRPHCDSILVIDDLADRKHDCDVLLDQTFGRNRQDYQGLVRDHCKVLCGTTYALLRPEFSKWRQYSLERRKNNTLEHILVNLGGVDKDNLTSKMLDTLKQTPLSDSCKITVVMGSTSPWIEAVKKKAEQLPWPTEVKTGVSNMAELMANSDLAIGAAGSTSWERCCLGLPTLMLVLAENQLLIAKNLEDAGAVSLVKLNNGSITDLSVGFISKEDNLLKMSEAASLICDGLGAQRLLKLLSNTAKDKI